MHPNFSLLLSIIHSFPLTYNSPSSSLFYQSSSLLLFLCLVLCDQFCTPAFVGAFRGSEFPNASLSFCMLTSGTRRLRRSFALASRDPWCASHHDHVSHSSLSPLSVICLHQGRERETMTQTYFPSMLSPTHDLVLARSARDRDTRVSEAHIVHHHHHHSPSQPKESSDRKHQYNTSSHPQQRKRKQRQQPNSFPNYLNI